MKQGLRARPRFIIAITAITRCGANPRPRRQGLQKAQQLTIDIAETAQVGPAMRGKSQARGPQRWS